MENEKQPTSYKKKMLLLKVQYNEAVETPDK